MLVWGFFGGLIVGTLLVDILRFMVNPQALSLREASVWTLIWGLLAALFGFAVFVVYGTSKGLEFAAGYVIEWSLSMGNLFVFLMIFQYFAVPPESRQRVFFLGILGAVVLRCLFITDAVMWMSVFQWLVYAFEAFLVWVGIMLFRQEKMDVGKKRDLRFFTRIVPIENSYDGDNFFVRREGRLAGTALLPVILAITTANVIFAVDSIPAIFVISRDPFIVYTSVIFAILGLRALFFLLEGIMGMFRFLQAGLCVVLVFVGVKMLVSGFVDIPIMVPLVVVSTILVFSVVLSLLFPPARDPAALSARRGESDGKEGRRGDRVA